MKVTAVKAPAGLGKTTAYVARLERSTAAGVEIYVPTHDLAEDVAKLLRDLPDTRTVQVIKGRDRMYTDSERMCAMHERADALIQKGYPVYPLLCARRRNYHDWERCLHFYDCRYINQFKDRVDARIYTHASLPLARAEIEGPIAELNIIDESFFASCIETHSIPLTDLVASTLGASTQKVCRAVIEALSAGKALLQELRTAKLEPDIFRAVKECKREELPHFSPEWFEKRQTREIKRLPQRSKAPMLVECLAHEIVLPRAISHAVTLDLTSNAVKIHRRRPITRFSSPKGGAAEVLILDADANRQLIEPWFPDVEFVDIGATRNTHVTQCVSSRCSTTSLVPAKNADAKSRAQAEKKLLDIDQLILRKSNEGKRILVIGPQVITGNKKQGIPPLLTCPPGVTMAHFGGVRGIDIWKESDGVIIIGRNQPPIAGVEDIARAIWYDATEPLIFAEDWAEVVRGYRMAPGLPAQGVNVQVHPDPRVQAVVEQVRESETTQSIDRVRAVHAPETKEVIIFSNVPVDIDVDVLASFSNITLGTRFEQAWSRVNGAMPLAPAWLAETFPDLWSTVEAAKNDVGGQKSQNPNIVSIRSLPLLTYEYRLAGQTRRSHAISTLPVHGAQDELTRLLAAPIILREGRNIVDNIEYFGAVGMAVLAPATACGSA